MRKFSDYIGSQFGNPRGFIGKCCCLVMNIINKKMYKKIVNMVHLTRQSKVLDIGYGNGYLIKRLYKIYQTNIYGIDISEDMKNDAVKRNYKAVHSGKINLEIGDCCQLAYSDEFFDAVTSINTIYFWNDTVKGLQEIHRTLKSEGVFYNVVYTKDWLQKLSYTKTGFKFFTKDDFVRLGYQAGFTDIRIQDIVKGKSFVIVYKK